MKRVRSLVFHTLEFSDKQTFSDDLFAGISSTRFNEQSGYGLSLISSEDSIIVVKVIKRTATFINDYDEAANEFTRKQIYVYTDFQFIIDLNLKLLYVMGGLAQINYVRYIFRETLTSECNLHPVNLNAQSFYNIIRKRNIDAKIDHVTINHFNFNNELIGRFSGSVLNQVIASEMLEQYKSDIVKISFVVNINERECFTIQVFPNGSVKFLSELEEADFVIDYLKQIIFNNNG